MISIASLTVLRADAGLATSADFDAVPVWQWEIHFSDLAARCPDARQPELERRPGNALNVEIGTPQRRCVRMSPDGRGAAWLLSGGSLLAYGPCSSAACARKQRGA